jgi:hypothetical protein
MRSENFSKTTETKKIKEVSKNSSKEAIKEGRQYMTRMRNSQINGQGAWK